MAQLGSFGCFFLCIQAVTSDPQSLQWTLRLSGWPREKANTITDPHTMQTPSAPCGPAAVGVFRWMKHLPDG